MIQQKTKLSVNINKIALIRNSRGGNIPDLLRAALDIERFGADGITVHPRPDERHIRYNDVYELKKHLKVELNVEGNPQEKKFVKLIEDVKPAQVTLVPDVAHQLTSDHGWDTITYQDFLKDIVKYFQSLGCRVSIFVNPDLRMVEGAARTNTNRIELYTEEYAKRYSKEREIIIVPYKQAAELAKTLGIKVNAGHDLNLENLKYLKENIPFLAEVSIGHALISDALYYGLENTVRMYKRLLE
ncbi:MAG: pyridoxine 5'-phosphate synthase [Bacteroidia bacterium]|nr:MAG: pyridoxine 5'-phosphate synthase [Bacteroidia bacterium]